MDREKLPNHIAIVMDGNGRWARSKSLPRLAGHNAGMIALKEIVKRTSSLGVKHLTVYAFSTENWKRPENEVGGIFNLLVHYVERELEELNQNNVKVKIIGDYNKLPKKAVQKIEEALIKTRDNTGLQFNIALNYGSRDEIVRATKLIADKVANNEMKAEDITQSIFKEHLFTSAIPDPDLVIRTSGEKRLSNFLLWQSAYSEFVFTDTLWPDFTPECLEDAIKEYQKRVRRFGDLNED